MFGSLDADQDVQWVKINRTWLGEGDQNVYAQIQIHLSMRATEFKHILQVRMGLKYLNLRTHC